MLHIGYFSNSTSRKYSKNSFEKLLRGVNKAIPCADKKIGLHLVTTSQIHKLNKKYRGKDAPTDVLSFAYHEKEKFPGEEVFGEIFLCPHIVEKRAPLSGNTFEEELEFMFLHGILHLLGYDHKTLKEERRMNKLSYKILRIE